MVNTETWNQLGEDGQREFSALFRQFQNSLRANGIHDGYDLGTDWQVIETDGKYMISNGDTVLSGIVSNRRDVIYALYNDGVGNLNR